MTTFQVFLQQKSIIPKREAFNMGSTVFYLLITDIQIPHNIWFFFFFFNTDIFLGLLVHELEFENLSSSEYILNAPRF